MKCRNATTSCPNGTVTLAARRFGKGSSARDGLKLQTNVGALGWSTYC